MNNTLPTFNAINDFIKALSELVGGEYKPLKLYNRLISQTTLSHTKAINTHIRIFKEFCIRNREAIFMKDVDALRKSVAQEIDPEKKEEPKAGNYDSNKAVIKYSEKVQINVRDIFNLIKDDENRQIAWKHLLYISALLDPAGKAKEMLKTTPSTSGGNEAEFLTNLISKIETGVNPEASPMETIGNIMSSGAFTEIIGNMNSGLESGSLDLNKMMGIIQGMVTDMGKETNGDPMADQTMGMLSGMIGNMNSGKPPNVAELMASLSTMQQPLREPKAGKKKSK